MNTKKIIREEINNDMDWVKNTSPTLKDYIESKMLNIGDIIYLDGRTQNANGNGIMVNNIPFIVKRTYKASDIKYSANLDSINFYDIGYLHIEDANDNIFKVSEPDGFGLVEEDGYLNVTKHIPYKEEKEDGNNTWKLNESDDMEWIRDIDTSKFRPEIGDLIEVRNKGSEKAYLNWLGDYADYWDGGFYGYNIQGEVIPPGDPSFKDKGFNLRETNTGDRIYFPHHEYMLEFKDLDLEYYPLSYKAKPKTIKLKESDDLDWIRDVEPISYDFLVGKALYFDPPINDYEYLSPIIDALESMGFNQNWVDDFYEEYNDQIIGMYLREHDDQIIFTTDLNEYEEEYQEHINEYALRPVEVFDGWRILGPHLGTV